MTTQLRSKADQNALAESMVQHYGKAGVHFYGKGKARFIPIASFEKVRLPKEMVIEITTQLLMADLKKTSFAVGLVNNKLQLERVDLGA